MAQAETKEKKSKSSGSKKKRTLQDTQTDKNNASANGSLKNDDSAITCPEKKIKLKYELEKKADQLIIADVANKKYWDDCKELLVEGKKVCILYCFNV